MIEENGSIYEFDGYSLDTRKNLLSREGVPVRLPAKTLEVLAFLVRNNNRVVKKGEILNAVWPDTFVEEANLTVHIAALRKALADAHGTGTNGPIETFPKVGYRFTADVSEKSAAATENGKPEEISTDDGSQVPASVPRRNVRRIGLFAVAALSLPFLGAIYGTLTTRPVPEKLSVERLTKFGTVCAVPPAMSPDGAQVVYARVEPGGRFSLWVKLVGTSSETQVLTPTEGTLFGLRFLPDGKSLVIGMEPPGEKGGSFVMPLYGGTREKLPLEDAFRVSFSPNGNRVAFLAANLAEGTNFVRVANGNGSDLRTLTTRKNPNFYFLDSYPEWSPDGSKLAAISEDQNLLGVVEIDAETGKETSITKGRWSDIKAVAWLPDMSGLVVSASETGSSVFQIWKLERSDGSITRLTNDSSNYWYLSPSKDGRAVATIERRSKRSLWRAPFESDKAGTPSSLIDDSKATLLSRLAADGTEGTEKHSIMDWTIDGKLVFSAEESGNIDIWKMNDDGSERVQLTTDKHEDNFPTVSPDGRTIVFMSDRAGTLNLWKMDRNGGDQRQLTFGEMVLTPMFSRDGKWVYFRHWKSGKGSLWRVPLDGGEPNEVIDRVVKRPSISPDGKWIAYINDKLPMELVVRAFNGETPKSVLNISLEGRSPQWHPHLNYFSYLADRDGVTNLWLYDFANRETTQLTNFSESVQAYHWSPDGRNLAFLLGKSDNDVSVISITQ